MALIYKNEALLLPEGLHVHDWRETSLLFVPGGAGRIRVRKEPIRHVVGHWTGGEGNEKSVYNTLRQRDLSVHLFLRGDGHVFQYCDLEWVTLHAGRVNETSIGVEIQNHGIYKATLPKLWARFRRGSYRDTIKGHKLRMMQLTEAQQVAWVKLCTAICDGLKIPKYVPTWTDAPVSGAVWREYLNAPDLQAISGVIGHYHVAQKYDPGTAPLEALLANGFEPAQVGE